MLLTTQHLTLDHQKDLRNLVHDLNLIVNPGDKIAIIGEEGNGKSSLLLTLMDSTLVADYLTTYSYQAVFTDIFTRQSTFPKVFHWKWQS